MASTTTSEERSQLLREYVQLAALSTMLGNMLECGPLDDIIATEYHEAGTAIGDEHWLKLNPPDDLKDDPEFFRADAMSSILSGELLLALAEHRDWLISEGRRLVSVGRGNLAELDGLDAS